MYRKMKTDIYRWLILIAAIIAAMFFAVLNTPANQIGFQFADRTLGVLGDYEKSHDATKLALDAQGQRTDRLKGVINASVTQSFGAIGVHPFISYNFGTAGTSADIGALLNFNFKGLDIAAGASLRGANPTTETTADRLDPDGFTTRAGYNIETGDWKDKNAYKLPPVNNINVAIKTGFEWRKVETGLTAYIPLTERQRVPVVIISRSQTSLELMGNLSASVILDARTFVHAEGVDIEFKPIGALTVRF